MATLLNIAQYAISSVAYPTPVVPDSSHDSNPVILFLNSATTPALIDRVNSYVTGKCDLEAFHDIDHSTAYQLLAAVKLYDTTPGIIGAERSTHKLREICLIRSQTSAALLVQNTMLNAFSTPPLSLEDPDFMVTETNNLHPKVTCLTGKDRTDASNRIHAYAQTQALFDPEIAAIIEDIIRLRFAYINEVSSHLPDKSIIVYRGSSGAGKSHALTKEVSRRTPHLTPALAVTSTDNLKKDLLEKIGKVYLDQTSFLLALSIRKVMNSEIETKAPDLSSLQEGWFNTGADIKTLFTHLNKQGLKLIMNDFDGDFEALALRVLARRSHPDNPQSPLPLAQLISGYKTCRETRCQVLTSLREGDTYNFVYVNKQGEIITDKDPLSIPVDPSTLDSEIEATKNLVISEEHIKLYGEGLRDMIGLPFIAAYEKAIKGKRD